MRIISGIWRGRRLVAPAGDATRPTADRTREALFSMLTSRLGSFEGLSVADFFAGTGALGLEALSRGAAHCTFLERDPVAMAALRANIDSLGAIADVRAQSAEAFRGGPFDLVLLDPPYASGLGNKMLELLLANGALALGCLISIETSATEVIDAPTVALEVDRRFGKARLRLYRFGG